MTTPNSKMKVTVLALAVEAALIGLCAMPVNAADAQEASLKAPASFINFGGAYVSQDSAKFGEYSGMNKSGGYGIADFAVRGGDSYGDGDGTKRWSFTGSDLGLSSRGLDAAISDQGKWSVWLAYDELTHYTSDSYQTPYLGSMGGNSWTLPAGFAPLTNTRAMTTAQLGAFRNVDVDNTRKNGLLGGGFILNKEWDVKIDYNQLEQSGAKLMGFGSAQWPVAPGPAVAGQNISILPMAQNYKTTTVNASLNWKGESGNATFGYYGSYFRDNNNGVTFQTFNGSGGGAPSTQTMGTPPSNDFHQLNVTGGYSFSGKTKLAGGLSYGRNTQNMTYGYDSGVGVDLGPMVTASPTSSLNGSVITTHADLKLTDQTTKQLTLSAGVKYDKRDNQTASNIYNSRSIDGGNIYNYPNTPNSNSKLQAEIAGDYRLDSKQKIRLAYNYQEVKRWCNNFATGGGTPAYAAGTNCVVATGNKENSLGATYRLKASSDVNFEAAYVYSDRKSSFDENARTAMIGTDGNPPGGTVTGLNASNYRGFHSFFEASRTQNLLKAKVGWQANEKWSVDLGGRYGKDNFDTLYGVQNAQTWSLNLDTTYAFRENGTMSAYVTQLNSGRNSTDQQRTSASAAAPSTTAVAVPAGATWSNALKDEDTTIGFNLKQAGLMGGKLELVGDATYSLGKTGYNTTLNYSTTTSNGLTCSSSALLTCGAPPDIVNRMIQFKLTGTYDVDKTSKVRVGYIYQYLNAADYYYNGLQVGNTPAAVLPTNQINPSYAVNVVAVSYIYSFK